MNFASLTLFLVLFLTSCAHKGVKTQLSSKEQDSLHEESFMRYDAKRHQSLISTDNFLLTQLSSCHQGEYDKALSALKNKLQKNEENPYYWVVTANCYYLKKEYKKAKYYYQIASQNGPRPKTKALIDNNKALIELLNRNYDKSYRLLSQASKNAPKSLTPKFNLAQLQIQFGHLERAKRALSQLEQKAPDDIDVLASLGSIALMSGDNQQAVKYFEKIPENFRKRQDIAVHYALALYQGKQWEKARAFMLKVGIISSQYLREIERELSSQIDVKLNQ